MSKFMAHADLGNPAAPDADAPQREPSPEQVARMHVTTDMFLAHLLRLRAPL